MVNKKTVYEQGIRYIDAINMFNDLNEFLGADGFYRFTKDLRDMDDNHVPGFSYKGYMTGQELRKILDKMGIEYITRINSGTGVDENSDILIKPESIDRMLDIYNTIGMMQAHQRIVPNYKLEKPNNLDRPIGTATKNR